jgi:hypothetical protein
MFISWVKSKISWITNVVKDLAGTISDYLWFHSPTKKWPASDSDKWMPNLIWMLVKWLEQWKEKFSKVAFELSSVLVQQFGKTWNLIQIQEVLDDLENKFRQSFSWLTSVISESEWNIKNLKLELEWLQKQLETNAEKFKNLENYRERNFIGSMLMHHFLQSTKYMAKWIEEKNKA